MVARQTFANIAITTLSLILLIMFSGIGYVYKKQRDLEHHLADIDAARIELAQQIDVSEPTEVVQKVVSKSIMWRPIQEQVKDTVVQVFAQIAEFDILQPLSYSSPIFCVWQWIFY